MKKMMVAVVVSVSTLFATNTRVGTMGGVSDFLVDESNILTYSSDIVNFPNLFVFELGSQYGLSYLGGILDLGNTGLFGVYLNQPPFSYTDYEYEGGFTSNGFGMTYGKSMDGFDIGLGFGYATFDSTYNDSTLAKGTHFAIRPGVTFYFGEENLLQMGFSYRTYSWEYYDKTNDNGPSYDIALRSFLHTGENTTLIPYFRYSKTDMSSKVDTISSTDITTSFGAGLGFSFVPMGDFLIILGPTFNKTKYESGADYYTDNMNIYGVAGIEAPIADWLTFRMGAIKPLYAQSTIHYSDDMETKVTYQDDISLNFGLAFSWRDLRIDGWLNDGFLWSGPYFISGNTTSTLLWSVSLLYKFELL